MGEAGGESASLSSEEGAGEGGAGAGGGGGRGSYLLSGEVLWIQVGVVTLRLTRSYYIIFYFY